MWLRNRYYYFSCAEVVIFSFHLTPSRLNIAVTARSKAYACWYCGFESRRGADVCLLCMLFLSGSGIGVGLITRPGEC